MLLAQLYLNDKLISIPSPPYISSFSVVIFTSAGIKEYNNIETEYRRAQQQLS